MQLGLPLVVLELRGLQLYRLVDMRRFAKVSA